MSTGARRPWCSSRAGTHLFRRVKKKKDLAAKVKTGSTLVITDIYLLLLSWQSKHDKQMWQTKMMSKKNGRAKKDKNKTCTSCTHANNCWLMWAELRGRVSLLLTVCMRRHRSLEAHVTSLDTRPHTNIFLNAPLWINGNIRTRDADYQLTY